VGGRAPADEGLDLPPPPQGPRVATAAGLALLLFLLLVANGRPIGAGDTRPTERVAASLVQQGDFDLDEYPEVAEPFARLVGPHRVSIYPVLSAVLATPVFALAGRLFALDETGTALAGKAAASLFSALAAALLFLALGRRVPESEALGVAVVFALGTTVWATSQALWQHPAAVLFFSLALLMVFLAEDRDPAWAGRAGLPLALAVAARHADVALGVALALGIAVRWPRRLPRLALWSLPGILFVLGYQWAYFGSPLRNGFTGSLGRFDAPWGVGQLGLLISPGKGLLVFTPVVLIALVGLAREASRGNRWLALTLGVGVLAHWVLMGRWGEWHGGECWGPRLMTDAMPFLFVFLPAGLARLPRLGWLLAAASVGVQVLGAFAYDYRWERLYERPAPAGSQRELWSLERNPILFYLERRVLILALPMVRDRRAQVREPPVVVLGPQGSRIRFEGGRLAIEGRPAFGDALVQRAGRFENLGLVLEHRWDGLFLRVLPQARLRPLELRIRGTGRGPLYVGERTFWTDYRWTTHFMDGSFRTTQADDYPTSGGPDLLVTVGKGPGRARIQAVDLVSPDAAWDPAP
jgi:hypothetical protein